MDRKGGEGCGREGGEGWDGMWKGRRGRGWRGEEGKAKCFLDICLTWAGHLKISVSVFLCLPQV